MSRHPLKTIQSTPVTDDIVGVGVVLGLDEPTQTIRIMNILSNSPAAEAGLSVGLVVQKIDDVPTGGKTLVDCVNLSRGSPGSKVRLELVAPDRSEIETVELTRRKINLSQASERLF